MRILNTRSLKRKEKLLKVYVKFLDVILDDVLSLDSLGKNDITKQVSVSPVMLNRASSPCTHESKNRINVILWISWRYFRAQQHSHIGNKILVDHQRNLGRWYSLVIRLTWVKSFFILSQYLKFCLSDILLNCNIERFSF